MKYKTLSGQEHEITQDFQMFGMSALWEAIQNETNSTRANMLIEAHRIMSAVLYGTVGDNYDVQRSV